MANGSVLSNGQSHERNFDFKRGGPEEEPKPDVARLAALAQHLNPETDASDQANGNVRKHPPEPIGRAIDGSPGSPKNNLVERDRRSFGARIFRSVARFFIVALIGAGVTLGWQSHGEEAKQMVRAQAPSLAWLFPASTAKSPSEIQELKPMAADLAGVRRNVEQLAAQQERMAAQQQQIVEQQEQLTQSLAALQALEQEIKQKVSSPPPSRTVATPPRAAQSPAVHASPAPAQPPAGRPLPLGPLSR